MKYIRTKDGIISDKEKSDLLKMAFEYGSPTTFKIIAQADTIEELCDEFVDVNKTGHCISSFKTFKALLEDKNNHNFYGAIWTDKGLIYVAKMNDEGELELL